MQMLFWNLTHDAHSPAALYEEEVEEKAGTFLGIDGATSLKSEIAARIPIIADASQYREARHLIRSLGGAAALREELTFAGFVDPENDHLTLNVKPFNVFAQLAAGTISQPTLEAEQKNLGKYADKFVICANRPDNDRHWDSQDPLWISKASMARRHRFLTTKDLHWQWFNMLVVGLVTAEDGGADIRKALGEVEDMKAACLHYAKNTDGWSDQIGLFVNVFGHNKVNSLFIHILDMTDLGPGFSFQSFKNCPLDQVLKVLREEAASKLVATPVAPASRLVAEQRAIIRRRSMAMGKVPFFFAGTDGATSVKAELAGRVPVLKDASSFREARRLLIEELGGYKTLREELVRSGFVVDATGNLTSSPNPFNIFAMIVQGKVEQPGMKEENELLGELKDQFMVCCNRPVCDEHWDSEDPEWLGKASMSRFHRFLTTRNMHYQWFNALAFGIVPPSAGGASLFEALAEVERMKAVALSYASKMVGWSDQIGLFVHVFGHNTVNSLHVHILDMKALGPSFWKMEFKNCPLDAVIKVMKEELAAQDGPIGLKMATEAATTAMKAASEVVRCMTEQARLHTISAYKRSEETLTINVGGELVSLGKATVSVAPEGSALKAFFADAWNSPRTGTDDRGHPFLDVPPVAFKLVCNQLRMIQATPRNEVLQPPVVPHELLRDYVDLARVLGVLDLCAPGRAQWGRGPQREDLLPKRPGLCARRWRPRGPPPEPEV